MGYRIKIPAYLSKGGRKTEQKIMSEDFQTAGFWLQRFPYQEAVSSGILRARHSFPKNEMPKLQIFRYFRSLKSLS